MNWTRGQTIGRGSTAVVSIATTNSSIFAVKSADLSQSQALQREQKILSLLNSAHIITYKGHEITNNNYNIFLEYAAGGSLSDAIRRHNGPIPEPMIVDYTRQILQGVEYLHSKGLVHCDIKSKNILITETGAKIADFGCAKWETEEVSTGGTPMFMAPEVARGGHHCYGSDIWAIGCTVIEMASGGSTPWSDMSDPVTVLYKIGYSGETPEVPCNLSKEGKDFLSKCLRRDPKERWTATELLNHPFIVNSCRIAQESNSPTSVLLDQDIWDSTEEEEITETSFDTLSRTDISERIQRLLSCDEGPSWSWDDESWVTVRGYDSNSHYNYDQIEFEGKGSVLDFTVDKTKGRFGNLCGLCTYNENNTVISDRLSLLPPPLVSTSSIS